MVSPPPPEEAYRLAELYLALARRNNHSLVALAVACDPHIAPSEVARRIQATLRRTDMVVANPEDKCLWILCPEAPPQGAKAMAERIREHAQTQNLRIHAASATFPTDAMTLRDLMGVSARGLAQLIEPIEPMGPGSTGRRPPRGEKPTARKSAAARQPSDRLKRAFDLFVVGATLPFWLPVFALIALALKLSAPFAPVLFRQLRTGRGGHRFRMFKFRTMVPDAEARKADLAHLNELQWPDFKIEDDPRITRIGRFLRKTSLDELPQLLNIVLGDMSLVGPRPTSFDAGTYETWQTARLDVIPGLTGLWQIEGRTTTEFDERLRLDMAYIDQRSLWLDLKILFRTAGAVVRMRGAR